MAKTIREEGEILVKKKGGGRKCSSKSREEGDMPSCPSPLY